MARVIGCSCRLLLVVAQLCGVCSLSQGAEGQLPAHIKAALQKCDQTHDQRKYEAAVAICTAAASLTERKLGRDHVAMTVALTNLGLSLQEQGLHARAQPHLSRVVAILQEQVGTDGPEVAIGLNNLGLSLKELGKYEQAEALYRRALAIKSKHLGSDHPGVALSKNNLAALLMARGRYLQAEPLFKQALAIDEQHFGAIHPMVATDLSNLAGLYSKLARFKEAEQLYLRAQDIIAKTIGESHPHMATTLSQLGLLRTAQGRYREAEPLLRRALAISEQALGANHPHIATRLNGLGELLRQLSRYKEAEELLRRALAISERALGAQHHQVAVVLSALASVYQDQGEFATALSYYKRSLAMDLAIKGPTHPDLASDYNDLSRIYRARGEYARALKLNLQAMQVLRSALGESHPEYALLLGQLSETYRSQSRLADAEKAASQAMTILTVSLGEEHPHAARLLTRMAVIKLSAGDFAQAELLLTRSAQMIESTVGYNTDDMATVMDSQAQLYLSLGQISRAERLVNRAIEIDEGIFGQAHISLVYLYNLLGVVLSSWHDDAHMQEAKEFYRKSIKSAERILGTEHTDLAAPLGNLGLLLMEEGNTAEAGELLRRAYAIRVKSLGKQHPSVAHTQNNLGSLYTMEGRYREAASLHAQALKVAMKKLSTQHPLVATIMEHMAALELQQGRIENALARIWKVVRIEEDSLHLASTDTRTLALLESYRGTAEFVYGMVFLDEKRQDTLQLALTLSLLRKGAASDAGASFNYALHHTVQSPGTRALFEQWRQTRQEREYLLFSGPGEDSPAHHESRLDELLILAGDQEHKLTAALPPLNMLRRPALESVVKDVAAQLRPGEALIEFVFAQPFRLQDGGGTTRASVPHYLALLLFPDGHIAAQDLGSASPLEATVSEFLNAAQNPNVDPVGPALTLYQLSFAKLLPKLQGARRIYLSPDGAFHFIQFSALHDGTEYLLGQYQFLNVSSGRDLLRTFQQPSTTPPLVLAAPDFRALVFAPSQREAKVSPLAGEGIYLRLQEQPPLPGSEREAKVIESLIGAKALTGALATEQAVRQAHAPRILHIASHGVFLDDLPGTSTVGRRVSKLLHVGPEPLLPMTVRGALSRSALVLAGVSHASQAPDSEHDGLLTASEVTELDLWGTELVVLSACDTGKGVMIRGQGVYGLRRAFLSAGAQSLISSLWAIDDAVTEEFMRAYYSRLMLGQGRASAMVEAMKQIKQQKSHPYYWAPFLFIGRDGPLSWLMPKPAAVSR